jgi:hypothetical protein
MVKILEPEMPRSASGAVRQTASTAGAVAFTGVGVGLGALAVIALFRFGKKLIGDRQSAAANSGTAGQAPMMSFFGRRA